jgi:mRNA degradation ribonuclease J1/J2
MINNQRNKVRSFHVGESNRHVDNPVAPLRAERGVTTQRKTTGRSFSRRRFTNSNSRFGAIENQKKEVVTTETLSLPPIGESIRIIPLGGVEEIGKNMTAIEIGDDIIVVDAGFQFRDEDTPGVDYILPNTKYLEERKGKIRGVLITHGHLDHIGGIPYIMYRIGNPPLYSRALTTIMIKKRQEEFPHLPELDMRIVEKEDVITLGKIKIRFFAVTHTLWV